MVAAPGVVGRNIEKLDLFQLGAVFRQQSGDPLIMTGADHDSEQFMTTDRCGEIGISRFHGIKTAGPGFRIDRPAEINTALSGPFRGESVAQFARLPAGREQGISH